MMSLLTFTSLWYETNKFHVAACLFSDRSQKTSKCCVPLFCFLPNLEVHSPHSAFSTPRVLHIPQFPHPALRTPRFPPKQILTSSVIYYRTDARQHGINLLIWSKLTAKTEHSLYYGKYLFLNTTKSNAKPMLQPDLDYKYNHA